MGREKPWITCIKDDINALGIIVDWKEAANNAARSCEAVKGGWEAFMTELREKEEATADARHLKKAPEKFKLWCLTRLCLRSRRDRRSRSGGLSVVRPGFWSFPRL